MPKVSESHGETRRQQILQAAAQCFVEKGFHQTNMRAICKTAGLSPGAVYTYFNGKKAIIAAIVEQAQVHNTTAHTKSRSRAVDTPVGQIFNEHFLASLKDKGRRQQGVMNIDGIAEAVRDPKIKPVIRQAWGDAAKQLRETVKAGQQRGEISKALDPADTAWLLCATYFGLLAFRLISPALNTDAIGRTLIDLLQNSATEPE